MVHQGASIQSGHYIAYRKWPNLTHSTRFSPLTWISQKFSQSSRAIYDFFQGIPLKMRMPYSLWLLTSDMFVTRVSDKEVQMSPAYLLFYDRIFDTEFQTRPVSNNHLPNGFCTKNSQFSNTNLVNNHFDEKFMANEIKRFALLASRTEV